ncbi:MAG: 3-deoxy-D-manno-octulosonic acid transferase [Marinibacterium sp.]|nr:3-deoxy-D-manno-octulosonic acid transferase [Marinibacterium sp.]
MKTKPGAPTPLIRIYRALTALTGPLVYRHVARKLRGHDVAEQRIRERDGIASQPRPDGPLIWFHGASVGESVSVLTLIRHLGTRLPQAQFLITSGTATSAEIIGRRLPPRTQHQFAPLDTPAAVRRFYAHWRPAAGIFVESELWPNLLIEGRRGGVPLALLNARLSASSVKGWQRWPDTARQVLGGFSVMLAQNRASADNLVAMGADPARVRVGINLKATSDPLPVDQPALDALGDALGSRRAWIASSTHPGEEETVLTAHRQLLDDHPDLCLILAPRHPERRDGVAALIGDAGLQMTQRSTGALPEPAAQVYLADTLGELGTLYALSPIVFLGGSLKPIGGHNPFEPAQSGAAVLTGPHVTNFTETFDPLIAEGGAQVVSDSAELATAVARWLDDDAALDTARSAATDFAAQGQAALQGIIDLLCRKLDLEHRA